MGMKNRGLGHIAGSAMVTVLMLTSGTAQAQNASSAAASDQADETTGQSGAPAVQDIVVTGSRIKRDGYTAPTPETVLSAANIAAKAPSNIADYVNSLPQLANSSTPRTGTQFLSSGTAGSNFLNLRGLNPNRTLVLLDSRRVVGSSVEGLVDINTLPSALISRVDVVTGGASAAYGSDAVAGVVNFVLDTKFTGVKLLVQNGISTYGDDRKSKIEAAFGGSFADGRWHILLSGTYANTAGVLKSSSRPWFKGDKIISNPARTATNGLPLLINAQNVNTANAAAGGQINSGVLAGTTFDVGGGYRQRVFGTPAGAYTIGGERQDIAVTYALEVPLEQYSSFGRLSFDVTDNVELFVEGSYAHSLVRNQGAYNYQLGNLTIRSDNAFLDPALRARLDAAGQTSFNFGTYNTDIGRLSSRLDRTVMRYVGGVNADLGSGWTLDAYAQYGQSKLDTGVHNDQIKANYARAIDAVRDPATGQIVCRSTLTSPGNGCVPFNVFGMNVNSAEAIDYVRGVSQQNLKLQQTVGAMTVQGEPFSTWAGPVSLALGAEYRKEKVSGSVDAISAANGFFGGNYKPTNGSYDVKEAFVETIVPLARDLPFAYSLDLNAAVRYTDYSISGTVTTWKFGATYNPFKDLRLRFTRSRDIRAPNLSDLFLGGIVQIDQTVIDGSTSVAGILTTVKGSTALAPERADTLTAGAVYSPSFLPGFSVSFDYYDIDVKDAIITPDNQTLVSNCNAGNTAFCDFITRDSTGRITNTLRTPINAANDKERGFDIEASYNREIMADTQLSMRALATHIINRSLSYGLFTDIQNGESGITSGNVPNWRVTASVGITHDPFNVILTSRYVSSGVFDKSFTSATLADNHISGATYYDLATSVKLTGMGIDGEFFFNVDNLFNKDPVIVAPFAAPVAVAPVNAFLFDTIGREFRAGFRLNSDGWPEGTMNRHCPLRTGDICLV